MRTGKKGETMVVPVTAGAQLPHAKELVDALQKALPGLRSVVQNVNSRATQEILGRQCVTLWGEDRLEDKLLGLTFRLSPLSFYQVNPMQTERLYRQAIDFAALTGGETVADAYCGAGTIGLSLARRARRVVGIEIVEPAVRDAKENARRNGVTNAEFYAGPCEKLLPQLASKGLKFDAVVLDPPRKGCDEACSAPPRRPIPRASSMSPAIPQPLPATLLACGSSAMFCAKPAIRSTCSPGRGRSSAWR